MVLTQDCHDDASNYCRLCTGDYPAELVEDVLAAAAGTRITVTRAEFTAWLARLEGGESTLRE